MSAPSQSAGEAPRQAYAQARYIRMSSRKVRLVVDAIRGKPVAVAEDLLRFIPRAASDVILKVLRSAKANAVNNFSMLEDALVVKTAYVDDGPTLKRILPRARGRGDTLRKRTSHITIILEESLGKPKRGGK
jgi:large subunit ribosomal protein L22